MISERSSNAARVQKTSRCHRYIDHPTHQHLREAQLFPRGEGRFDHRRGAKAARVFHPAVARGAIRSGAAETQAVGFNSIPRSQGSDQRLSPVSSAQSAAAQNSSGPPESPPPAAAARAALGTEGRAGDAPVWGNECLKRRRAVKRHRILMG